MKKITLILVVFLMTLACIAIAEETPTVYTSGDYGYILLDDGTAEITYCTDNLSKLDIPKKLDGYWVTSIGDFAFNYCTSITEISIPDSVTSIGVSAFFNCNSLTEIIIPDSVTCISSNPFILCTNLTKIKVSPDHPTLATINGVLFDKREKKLICYPCAFTAENYSIPHGISSIGVGAFAECKYLTEVIIPDSVTSIGYSAFSGCTFLTKIGIPDSVTSIGDFSFCDCKSLTEINIPNNVSSIGDSVFRRCESLTEINIPKSVKTIGERAFIFCETLTEITIPDSVTSIGDSAFDYCDSLTLTVKRDSYAAQYAKENNIDYTYTDALDWLNS